MPDAPVINGMIHSLEIHFQRQPKPLRSAQGPIWGRRWDHHENKSPIFVSNRDVMRLNSRGFPKRPVSPSNRGKQKASADAKVSARAPRRQTQLVTALPLTPQIRPRMGVGVGKLTWMRMRTVC